MPRLGRKRTDPEPWIEQLVLSYGTAIPQDRAVKATVIGARDLTESQDETDASCVIFLSDGLVFIPAVLTTQAWSRLQDMEERESYSGLENAIVCVKNLQLNFHMEPELASCQFYVTVNQMSTVGQGSSHDAVPNCATLLSVKEQIHKLWRSRVDESSSQSQYGFRLTDLLEEWERDGGTQISPQEVTGRPTPLSGRITSQNSMNLPTHYTMNTPPGPSATYLKMTPPTKDTLTHCMVDSFAESSTSHHSIAPPTDIQQPQSLDDIKESQEETQLLRKIIKRLASPIVPVSDGDVTTPTQWHQDRLSYKAEECFSVPVHHLLIPEDQREKMITMATVASTSCSVPSGLVPPPMPDRQTAQPISTQTESPDQLPLSGERMDDSPCSSVLVDAESVREGGGWDIFAPVLDMLKSPSSSELSATPEDLPLLQSQSASVLPENLPLLQSQSARHVAPIVEAQSDSATPENLPITKSPSDSNTPEDLLFKKVQSDSATPENLPLIQSQAAAAAPKKQPLLQSLTSLCTSANLKYQNSQLVSSSLEKFPLHQSLLSRLSSAPIGTSTQNPSSNSSGPEKTGTSLPPYQPPLPLGISPSQLSGKRLTPRLSPEEEDEGKTARSPPSWIVHTQGTGSNHSQTGSQPKRRMFNSPSKQSWVHPDGSAFSYKYKASVENICALGQFTVPADMIQWSVRYLMAPSHTSTEEQGQATGAQKL